jgi:hypothetical protein
MPILGNDILKVEQLMTRAGLFVTLTAVSLGVFAVVYLARAVENYIRHLHKKSYLPFGSARFMIMTLGFILVADGAFIGFFFSERLPLEASWVTISAGLVLLIASAVMSLLPTMRQVRQIHEGGPRDEPPPAPDDRGVPNDRRESD